MAACVLIAAACGSDTSSLDALGVANATATPDVGTTITEPAAVVTVAAATPIPTPTTLPTATPAPRTSAVDYQIVSGDVLGIIAERYAGVSTQDIINANPDINVNALQVGQTIVIPPPAGVTATDSGTDTAAPAEPTQTPLPRPTPTPVVLLDRVAGQVDEYTVASGDFISNIAIAHGVSQEAIVGANGLTNIDSLFINQCLIIPPVGSTSSPRITATAELCPSGTALTTDTLPTATPTDTTPTPTPTVDPDATATPTPTLDPNVTVTPTPTITATPTVDPNATATAVPSPTPTPCDSCVTATPTGSSNDQRIDDDDPDGYSSADCTADGGTINTGNFGFLTCRLP